MTDPIRVKQFHDSEGTEAWRVLGDGAHAYFPTDSFAASARLVQAIAELPGLEDHQPDVDLRLDGVTVRLVTTTDTYAGMTQPAVDLARPGRTGARGHGR